MNRVEDESMDRCRSLSRGENDGSFVEMPEETEFNTLAFLRDSESRLRLNGYFTATTLSLPRSPFRQKSLSSVTVCLFAAIGPPILFHCCSTWWQLPSFHSICHTESTGAESHLNKIFKIDFSTIRTNNKRILLLSQSSKYFLGILLSLKNSIFDYVRPQ